MNKKEKKEFLRELLELQDTMKHHKKRKNHIERELDVRIKNRTLDKMQLKIKQYSDAGVLPYIDIPEVMHTEDHGDLVFRIDKEQGTIRILRRIYEWDSDKDDIDDE